jgi:Leucine-rich repeat (LRR) protein
MQKLLSLAHLLLGLLTLVAFSGPNAHAQSDQCPRIIREGSLLRTDSAQSYQWYKNGERIPGATEQSYQPLGPSANYSVEVQGKASTPFAFEFPVMVNLIGQAFDEYLRPVAYARITVGNQTTESDAQGRFQFNNLQNEPTILLRGEKAGHWTSQRRIMPNGSQTHVQLMLRSQPFEHELSAERGGTISRGPFFLILQPNGVLDANNQRYTGVVKIALNGGRPDDPNFGWMMPGGDFMAQDAQGRERILYSYGFLSAQLQTPSGQPLKLDPNIGAQLRFVMPHTMVANAPDSLPLWHFDEAAAIWKEEGIARREGAAYIGTVRHFSSWNCDWPGPWCFLNGKTVDCKGRPISGSPLRLGQQIITSDSAGNYSGHVPATLRFDIQSMNGTGKIIVGPFEEGSENDIQDLTDGRTIYGFGVIDTKNTLKITSYGERGEVGYSIDSGATYQPNNTYATHIDSTYQVVVRDSLDCPTNLPHVRLGAKSACQLLDSAALTNKWGYNSIESALASAETVYRLALVRSIGTQFPSIIIPYFPCLHQLWLDNNELRSLPESFGNLIQLQRLSLRANQLTSLPETFGNLSQLQELRLEQNRLSSLPESLGNLTQLKLLELSGNQISNLPESIGNLTQLQRLELSSNDLRSVPESFGNLTQLKYLMLSHTQLMSLPESFGNLTQLKELFLYANQLSSLPESIGNLTQLEMYLDLSNNYLSRVPESFGNLTQLQRLGLQNNQLSNLPESFGNLTQLQRLELSSNQLTRLPESFGNLNQLQNLYLDHNQLSSLPESIGNLSQLENLRLDGNQLTRLPESIGNLSQLRDLNLARNPIPPAEIERIRRALPNCNVITN